MKVIFIFFSIVFLTSCPSETLETTCNVSYPLENLDFLKDAKATINSIDCGGKSSITQYTYKSETVFEVNICSQIADGETLVYNCSGEIVCKFGGITGVNTCPDFEKEATDKIVLYGN